MPEGYEYYKEIEALVKEQFSQNEAEAVERAYYFAFNAHNGQKPHHHGNIDKNI